MQLAFPLQIVTNKLLQFVRLFEINIERRIHSILFGIFIQKDNRYLSFYQNFHSIPGLVSACFEY